MKLVVAQTGCTEEKAREALKEEKGDLINASEFREGLFQMRRGSGGMHLGGLGGLRSGGCGMAGQCW